jgi:pectate lyase
MTKELIYLVTSLCIIPAMTSVKAGKPIEGFGAVTTGGEGEEIYHVTNLNNSGSGSLRDAISQGNRYVVFDTAGTIIVDSELRIKVNNLTIDGSTAPEPGITIKKSILMMTILGIIGGAQDVIIRHLRVQGWWDPGDGNEGNVPGTIYFDGDTQGDTINRIVLAHITTRNAYDSGLDIWGEIRDVTIQYCLIAISYHPQTISHYPAPFQERKNISIHHCIYANNLERNPQMRALTRNIDYVNNIIYDWFWYGIRIKNKWQPDEPKVSANLINNAFIPGEGRRDWALVYGESPGADERDEGPDSVLPQGTVYTESDMDSLYVFGNLLPEENEDHYSTISEPLPIPAYAQVTTYDVSALADSVVPFVGTHYPLEDEVAIFNAVYDSLNGLIATSGESIPVVSSHSFHLYQNYPNPFNPKTIINYELQITNYVELRIYNILAEKVATLVNQKQAAGKYQVEWDATGFASGVYYYQLRTEAGFVQIKKLVLLK